MPQHQVDRTRRWPGHKNEILVDCDPILAVRGTTHVFRRNRDQVALFRKQCGVEYERWSIRGANQVQQLCMARRVIKKTKAENDIEWLSKHVRPLEHARRLKPITIRRHAERR